MSPHVWTNQEVGFALGKNIPIICVKLGIRDPQGFIGSKQALKAQKENIFLAATEVQKALINEIGQEGRLKEVLIEAFITATNFSDAIDGLDRLTKTTDRLTDVEFKRILDGYARNDQLYNCVGIHNRGNWFKRYLEDATGKQLEFKDRRIIEVTAELDDDIPF